MMFQWCCCVLLLALSPLWLAFKGPLPAGLPPAASQWEARLAEIDQQLRNGEWAGAERSAGDLADEIARSPASGTSDNRMLARATTSRAIALAGLGRQHDAVWFWHAAQNIDPSLRQSGLTAYGAVGAYLDRHRLRGVGETPRDVDEPRLATGDDEGVTPPGPLYVPRPAAPPSLAPDVWQSDTVEIEAVVGTDGRLRSPVVVRAEMSGKIYLGLEALRRWRFRPARWDGEPVPFLLPLIEFTVPDSLAFRMARSVALPRIHRMLMKEQWDMALAELGETPGPSVDEMILRALAEAGRGEEEKALPWWHMALQHRSELERLDLSAYGTAGEVLARSSGQASRQANRRVNSNDGPIWVGGEVQRPERIWAPAPRYPAKAKKDGIEGVVIVRTVIDRRGRVAEIEVLKGLPMGLTEAAVEAISQWRYEPATLHGEPVDVYYNLTMYFRLAKQKRE